jgi:hypothetical protein
MTQDVCFHILSASFLALALRRSRLSADGAPPVVQAAPGRSHCETGRNRMREQQLTIGELFPADDLVAQWMFLLSMVVDDLQTVQQEQKAAIASGGDPRRMLFSQRVLTIRLYEARRLVYVVDSQPAIASFIAQNDFFEQLRRYYHPIGASAVDQLYGVLRHQSVHYMWPGSDELASALRVSARLPHRAAGWVKIALTQGERFADPQTGRPEHDDHPAQPKAIWIVAGAAHDRDDLLDGRRVRRIPEPLVSRRAALVKAGQGRWRAASASAIQQRHRFHDVLPRTMIDTTIVPPTRTRAENHPGNTRSQTA